LEHDLFRLQALEPPAGDLGIRPVVSACRAVWTTPLPAETGAPAHRIIHSRTLQLHAPAKLQRVGLRRSLGYHKCGSHAEHDWVRALRVLIWTGSQWDELIHVKDLPSPNEGGIHWIELNGIETSSALFEIRECASDRWWPSWNLCAGGLVLDGEPPVQPPLRGERALSVDPVSLSPLPPGVQASHANGEVRFRSRYLDVGFCLRRAGLSWLGMDDEGKGRTGTNLLRMSPGISVQGFFLHPVGAGPTMSPSIRYAVRGTTRVEGNVVTYSVHTEAHDQHYTARWEIHEDHLDLQLSRTGGHELRAWESSAWSVGFDPRSSAATALGSLTRVGESGTMRLPVMVHAPGFGSFDVQSDNGASLWRSDAFRPADLSVHQTKLGELPQPEGDYLLLPGTHTTSITFTVRQFGPALRADAPEAVRRAVDRCTLTSLSYRPDTGTLSNNGNSMHCPLCMDNWSALATRIGPIVPGLSAVDLLRDSIERWLDGGPGYASGVLLANGAPHLAEDEYIMTGTAGLLGVADLLEDAGSAEWLDRFGPQLRRQLSAMKQRDVDGDGIVESVYRRGISGEYQWATCFYDVISFGWKCTFSNALLYAALRKLARVLPALGHADIAEGLETWAGRLKENYLPAFFNSKTGWLAGWRCKNNLLHDHAFITINGAAVASGVVDIEAGRGIMQRIWGEATRLQLPYRWGMPASLWPIPDSDLSEIQHGFPFGYYGNGGLTTAQTRHVATALYRVGMTREADDVLVQICSGLANAELFGGAKSGIDGRSWDGWPCGYEGLLTDQFGILAVAMDRYAIESPRASGNGATIPAR
jgi:hypothetical protein